MKRQRCYLYLRMHSMGRLSTAHIFFSLELVRSHSLGSGWWDGKRLIIIVTMSRSFPFSMMMMMM